MTTSLDTAYAHSLPGKQKGEWEPLGRHLQAVSELAAAFASAFGAREWGRLVGAWHDLGKLSDAFQKYIGAGGDPDAGEYEARVDLKEEVRQDGRPPRSRDDYTITIDEGSVPRGVTVENWV